MTTDSSAVGPRVDEDAERSMLDDLGKRFMAAMTLKNAGDVDGAEDLLRALVKAEPRLPEPHLELARLLLDTDRLAESETHAREGLSHLEQSGPWTDELPEHIVKGVGYALLAEILRRIADEDDVIFGDPDRFHALVEESKKHFQTASDLDSDDSYSSYYAFFLGEAGHQAAKT